jgi:nucleotide-binding universal stress UspA family protein
VVAIKTILAATSGGSASAGGVELACALARRFDAHLEGFHAKPDLYELMRYDAMGATMGSTLTASFIEKFDADTAAVAAKVKAEFAAALGRHQLSLASRPVNALPGSIGASADWREETGDASTLVARRARFADLVVLGRSERVVDQVHSDVIEETLVTSGRPVLLAPATVPKTFGERVALGWNGSAEAIRAMTGALSFLGTARETLVLTIGDEHQESAQSVVGYLAWHDIKAKHLHITNRAGLGMGSQLLTAASDAGADFLAMGGYGHTPWRELLFGGATREVVARSHLPVLLAH